MELDCLTYGAEMEEIQEKNSREKVHYGTEDDFKYSYKKEDVLLPVLNQTLYWGSRRWRHPLCLRDVIDVFTNMKDVRDKLQFTTNPESGEEETDMCKAWEDIKKDERKQGGKYHI